MAMEKNEKKRIRREDLEPHVETTIVSNSLENENEILLPSSDAKKQCREERHLSENAAGDEESRVLQTKCSAADTGILEQSLDSPFCRNLETSLNGGSEFKRYKKRKIALIIAYCGAGYQGMQRNPGAVTIEGELEKALHMAGAIQDSNMGQPKKLGWMRAARTDKGVSALGQVVSGNFFIDPPGLVERANSYLPKNIRLLGYKRVTPSFNAKQMCVRRRYEYVLPAHVFDPQLIVRTKVAGCFTDHEEENRTASSELNNDETPIFSEGQQSEKIISSEFETDGNLILQDGQKVIAAVEVGESGSTIIQPSIDSPDKATPNFLIEEYVGKVSKDKTVFKVDLPVQETREDPNVLAPGKLGIAERQYMMEKLLDRNGFKFEETAMTRLNRILGRYVGTHNFHNFTPRTKADDPSALRYIISCEVENTFTVNGMEFIRCSIVGQSFMLHQIRRMIGLAVAIMLRGAPESMLETSLRRDCEVKIPMAPELGLFLEECYFSSYNSKFGKLHEEVSLIDYAQDVREFKHGVIYPHIAATEAKEFTFASWLQTINDFHFPNLLSREKECQSETASR